LFFRPSSIPKNACFNFYLCTTYEHMESSTGGVISPFGCDWPGLWFYTHCAYPYAFGMGARRTCSINNFEQQEIVVFKE
jgi:hypothetical protein